MLSSCPSRVSATEMRTLTGCRGVTAAVQVSGTVNAFISVSWPTAPGSFGAKFAT